MAAKTDFVQSTASEPHRIRTRKILKETPGIRNLIGKNPNTIFAIIGLVGMQVAIAYLFSNKSSLLENMIGGHPWWLVVLTAYVIGAFPNHSLFVMIHECTHQLLFKSRSANRWAAILANLPQIIPSAISFERYHIKHHSFQGVHELDADLPNRWEAKLINNNFIGKAIWLGFFPLFQLFRLSRLKEIKPFDGWMLTNFLIQVAFSASIWYFFGAQSFTYLFLSFWFSVGLHPLGARWIQEHYLTHGHDEQETYSYYGRCNKVSFNVGFHNEHHDFPSIPWNKLPEVKRMAPDYYDTLDAHQSWSKLFLKFLFSKEISLFNRIIRKERGKVKLTDVSKPDVELEAVA